MYFLKITSNNFRFIFTSFRETNIGSQNKFERKGENHLL